MSPLTNLKKVAILGLELGGGNKEDFFFNFNPEEGSLFVPAMACWNRESTWGRSIRSIKSVVSLSYNRETNWTNALFSLGVRSVLPPGL